MDINFIMALTMDVRCEEAEAEPGVSSVICRKANFPPILIRRICDETKMKTLNKFLPDPLPLVDNRTTSQWMQFFSL